MTIEAKSFLDAALSRGFDFFTGVPCSFLTPFINATINAAEFDYVGATSEGEAVGIAAGAYLAGRLPVVMSQNSGLGNMVNPLTSLNYPFRLPALLIVTWRGEPGLKDEPQHELMGEITHALLGTMRIAHRPFPKTEADIAPALDAARAHFDETSLPFALVMEKGSVADVALEASAPRSKPTCSVADLSGGAPPTRHDALRLIHERFPTEPIVATTGKAGRELFTLGDRENQIYLVGSMGCASAVALGVSRVTGRRTIVVDGDGAALMKLGALATVGAYAPSGLVHILLDNGVHDSTGGQATVSEGVDFSGIAASCGYRTATAAADEVSIARALDQIDGAEGPHFIHVRIQPGSIAKLGRPTVKPADVAARFRRFLAAEA
jgi:phosphonopyruvate decarboxylase